MDGTSLKTRLWMKLRGQPAKILTSSTIRRLSCSVICTCDRAGTGRQRGRHSPSCCEWPTCRAACTSN
eukprot:408283-Prymnesium_polylepis.1